MLPIWSVWGVVTGKSADSFAPEAAITRAEFVTMLARLSGDSLPAYSGPFGDVSATAYYAPAVAWAAAGGVTTGTTLETFSPNLQISRQEISAMVLRYTRLRKFSLPQNQAALVFTDAAHIHAYAREAVVAMQQAEIINGFPDGSFGPLEPATRAQVAKILALVHQLMHTAGQEVQ